jgi:ubiquinone/menaquinone biosynthesis C-methylase UbiE
MSAPAPAWQRDEAACRRYQDCSVRYILSPWAPELLARVQPCAGAQVLDVACGTGLIARLAAGEVGPRGRILGIDSSEHMLGVARSLPPPAGATIDWCHADAAHLPVGDGTCEVVLCHQGLQFFPDRLAALREVRRVLARQGRLAFAMWSDIAHQPYFDSQAQAVERYLGTGAGELVRSACRLCDPDEIVELFAAAGFGDTVVRRLRKTVHLPPAVEFAHEHLAGTSLASAVDGLEPPRREALFAQVAKRMEPYGDSSGMMVPFEIHLVYWAAGPDHGG